MRVYVDASILLRIVFGEPDRLETWTQIDLELGRAARSVGFEVQGAG